MNTLFTLALCTLTQKHTSLNPPPPPSSSGCALKCYPWTLLQSPLALREKKKVSGVKKLKEEELSLSRNILPPQVGNSRQSSSRRASLNFHKLKVPSHSVVLKTQKYRVNTEFLENQRRLCHLWMFGVSVTGGVPKILDVANCNEATRGVTVKHFHAAQIRASRFWFDTFSVQ